MIKKLKKAHTQFVLHFHYAPEFPQNLDFDQETFAQELQKCVEDDFDYTIEKYGTVPTKMKGLPDVIID